MRRSPIQSLASSPTMVGAVTVLIAIVAVFLAYNANNGLPFVPVYRVSVEIPNGARLVKNNEVRIGGHRVGVVESIEPCNRTPGSANACPVPEGSDQAAANATAATAEAAKGSAAEATDTSGAAALLQLKLDKTASPIPEDSIFRVRYRSSFGLKYLEIVRGTGTGAPEGYTFNGLNDHGTCKLPVDPATFADSEPKTSKDGCFQPQTEFDAINDTFDRPTRTNSRTNLVGFGDAFAGRGASLNDAIAELRPVFSNLRPVSNVLADPSTGLSRFIQALANTSAIVAPVATEQADFFTQAGIAFAAISSDPEALKATISEGPPTLETGIRVLPAQRTFLAKFAELSRRLRPGIHQLNLALPDLNDAIRIGTPIVAKTPPTNRDLHDVLVALKSLVEQDSTKRTFQRLKTTFDQATPLAKYVVPVQTVCNYWNYWFTFLTEHITERDSVGYQQRVQIVNFPHGGVDVHLPPPIGNVSVPGQVQTNLAGYSGLQANGKAGPVPNPADNGKFEPHTLPIVHGNPYAPLGQPKFNEGGQVDCQAGQTGYVLGQYRVPGQSPSNPAFGVSNIPGARGVTDVYLKQNGKRVLKDTRIPSHQP